MFTLGVAADILCLYIWPSTLVVEDVRVMLFYGRVSDADTMLRDGVLLEGHVTGDLEEIVRYSRGGKSWGHALLRELNVSLASLFMDVETALDLQGSEVSRDAESAFVLIYVWTQFISLAAFTI
jgi:hypothetical protein